MPSKRPKKGSKASARPKTSETVLSKPPERPEFWLSLPTMRALATYIPDKEGCYLWQISEQR